MRALLLRAVPTAVALLVPSLAPREARAWDVETHRSIVNAARRLSPAFDARLPADAAAVLEAAGEADGFDKRCVTHREEGVSTEAWDKAARLLADLRSGKPRTPAQKARMLGEYLHYVADCAEPRSLLGATTPSVSLASYDLAVYREPRPLAEPLGPALRARAADALWGEDAVETIPGVFRSAVNLTVEAGLLLAPRPDAASAPDSGPALFVVNNFDSLDPRRLSPFDREDAAYGAWSAAVRTVSAEATDVMNGLAHGSGSALKASPSLARRGLHLLEWMPHKGADGARARVLLLNAQSEPVTRVRLTSGGWSADVPGALPPWSLRLVELEAAPRSPDDVQVSGRRVRSVEADGGAVAARRALLYLLPRSGLPDFVAGAQEVRLPEPPAPPSSAVDVEYGEELEKLLDKIHVAAFTARAGGTGWILQAELETPYKLAYVPLSLDVEVTGGPAAVRKTVRMDVRGFEWNPHKRFESEIPDRAAASTARPRVRIVAARRETAP